jgi:peptide/nickel transport system permease protein
MLHRAPLFVVVLVVVAAVLSPLVAALLGVSVDAVDPARRFADADHVHLLGCDALGRDLFVRLLAGARTSVLVAVAAALVSMTLGVVIGATAALRGGLVDALLMRGVDALAALPTLPVVLLLAALDVGKTPSSSAALTRVVLLLSAFGWMATARLVRAQARHALTLDHVAAARALGASEARIIAVHVLPLCAPAVIVQTSLEAAENLVAEGALSFLGLGVPPPVPSWGNMLTGALDLLAIDPPTVLLPAFALTATAISLQLLGDAARARFADFVVIAGTPGSTREPVAQRASSKPSTEPL